MKIILLMLFILSVLILQQNYNSWKLICKPASTAWHADSLSVSVHTHKNAHKLGERGLTTLPYGVRRVNKSHCQGHEFAQNAVWLSAHVRKLLSSNYTSNILLYQTTSTQIKFQTILPTKYIYNKQMCNCHRIESNCLNDLLLGFYLNLYL